MFVHISPELEALGETISTLKFAERVATVELGAARVNKDSSDVKELKEQVLSLSSLGLLVLHDKISSPSCVLIPCLKTDVTFAYYQRASCRSY